MLLGSVGKDQVIGYSMKISDFTPFEKGGQGGF
jgi:hypothetical protein